MAMADEFPPELPSLGDEAHAAAATGTRQLLERAVLLLLFAGLLLGVLAVLRPFATAILFGTILAIAAWPLRDLLLRHGLKRGLAATLLLLLALAVVVLPLLAVAPGLGERLTQGAGRVQDYFASSPQIPPRLAGLPVVGERLANAWNKLLVAEGDIRTVLEPYSDSLRQALIGAAGALGQSVLQIILSLVVATFFWVSGDTLAATLRDILRRLGGEPAAADAGRRGGRGAQCGLRGGGDGRHPGRHHGDSAWPWRGFRALSCSALSPCCLRSARSARR